MEATELPGYTDARAAAGSPDTVTSTRRETVAASPRAGMGDMMSRTWLGGAVDTGAAGRHTLTVA